MAVPVPNIGLALEVGERGSIVDEPAELLMPVVALAPLFDTDGLLLPAVAPVPVVVPAVLPAVMPGPHGCGLTFVFGLLGLRMPPKPLMPPLPEAPPLMPADPVEPAPPALLPPPAPPPACAKATVEPAARNAAVRMARV